ncbi:hypothetical protein Tco_0832456, partial [Tanacetum coccineum]
TGYHCSCGVRWEVVLWGAISSRDLYMEYVQDLVAPEKVSIPIDEMWHGSYDVPRCPTICSANGNGNGDGNGFNRPSMPDPVASAVTVAAQLGRRFPVSRFNLSCMLSSLRTLLERLMPFGGKAKGKDGFR